MGSWGIDTFENDTACDVLGDAIESLKKVVRRDIKNLQTKSGRTILERRTVPALAVIDAIASAIPSARHSLAADEVEEWKSIYVA